MANSATIILDQALGLSAIERANIAEKKYFLALILLIQKLILFGPKKQMHVLRHIKKVK